MGERIKMKIVLNELKTIGEIIIINTINTNIEFLQFISALADEMKWQKLASITFWLFFLHRKPASVQKNWRGRKKNSERIMTIKWIKI